MPTIDPSDAFRVIQGVKGTPAAPVVEGRADRPFSAQLTPGQEVRGEVVASLPSGRFLVKIAGSLLDMNLPATARPGEMIQLTFMAEKPRLTFTLGQQGSSASPTTVSDAGRWLTLLARTTPGQTLPLDDITRIIQHSVKGAVLVTGEETGTQPQRLPLTPGQQARAEVVAELPNGRLQVKVADQLLEMNLPRSARTGSQFQLMLIADKPQLLFAMTQGPNNPAGKTLTEIGRWLSFATRVNTAQTPASSQPPLLPLPTDLSQPASQGLAGRLREALSRSGIFYESHVAEWAAGKSTMQNLLREPQGKLSIPVKTGGDPAAAQLEMGKINGSPGAFAQAGTAPGSPDTSGTREIADQQTLHLIRQQLSLLHNAHFAWQGEAWPGQQMEWSVEERGAEADSGQQRDWSTTLSLDLPHLGRISADLHMQGKQLQVRIQTDSPSSTASMREQTQKLHDGLAATGLTLSDLVIAHEDQL